MRYFFTYILVSTLALTVVGWYQYPDNLLHIVACDVGQGDAILIYQGFSQVLIDGGPNTLVESCLEKHIPWYDRNIEMVVLTHPHEDHIFGLVGVLQKYSVGILVANNISHSSDTFKVLRDVVWDQNIAVVPATGRQEYRVGKLSLRSLYPQEDFSAGVGVWPSPENTFLTDKDKYVAIDQSGVLGAYTGDLNDTSIVLRLTYENIDVLLTGDMTSQGEQALMTQGLISDMEVLKVAHHGSKYSSSFEFLQSVDPEWSLVSVGKGNRYGHPAENVLMQLDSLGSQVLRTDEMGELELVSDGERVWQE